MPRTASPEIVVAADARACDAPLLVIPLFEGESGDPAFLDHAVRASVADALGRRELTGASFEQWWAPSAGAGPRTVLLGAGAPGRWSLDAARRWATAAAALARQRRMTRVAVHVREVSSTPTDRVLQALIEGVLLAQHDNGHMKSTPADVPRLGQVTFVVTGTGGSTSEAVRRGQVLGASTNLARAMGNEPSNVLTPRELARRAEAAADGTSLQVRVLDENAMAEAGMGLLLGVSRGSAEPPRMILLEHTPPGPAGGPVLGLVGKGVTFDSGGISIKPAEGMERMKVDMAGGAAVIGAMRAASLLGAPVRVVGVIPATENMPGGRAIKPGDVLRGAAGKTVEVVNTDAEGRLILADALWQARRMGATHLVDVATLTGACVIALGRVMAGVFGGPPAFLDAVLAAGERAGDRCWPMPTADEYFDQLKSEVADMTNTGGRPAGAVTAALFLKQFAGGLPWAHIDIAGVAWADENRPWQSKGATGAATRLLAELALAPEGWKGLRC